jgi:hypothetical protein
MFRFRGGAGSPVMLRHTIKAVAVIGFLSYSAAMWFASGSLDRSLLAGLAGHAPGNDPAITGSLAEAAQGAKLDPCARPRRP